MKVGECPVCGRRGSLTAKKVKVGKKFLVYYYVAHYAGVHGKTRKLKWHYVGKDAPPPPAPLDVRLKAIFQKVTKLP